ncbi:phage tail tape measure protein [Streptomyces phytophilus]|uniref:phage tail tape measure protein n=1 Tax=Streptomyces phytophilus TaxID=722715 RepID=UPI0015F08792|nr:phage tail tape measure protein [Streptomyces phytophilus]
MATLDELLVAIGMDTGDLVGAGQEAANDVENSLSGIGGAAAGVAVGGLFTAGLSAAMDATAATTKLQNQLGLTGAEAERAGDTAGAVFKQGFGGSIDEVTQSLGAVISNVGGMGKATDAELQQMTKSALALADTFEFEVAASTQAMGTLLKAGLVKDGTQAFDLLTAAAQKVPPAMREELPDVTKEYSEFFAQLGFTGPEMFGLLAQAAQNPTFELDKLGDAVKEFTLRLADTEAVKQPLADLGLDITEIQGLVNKGQGTQAFDMVTDALKGVEDQTERTALQAALFGGPGEDLGNSLLKLDAAGAAAATGMDDAAGAAKKITDSTSAAQQMDAIWRTLTSTIGEALAPGLKVVSDFLASNPELVSALTPIVLALAVALGVWAAVQWALNSALLASPTTWIILGIVALVAAIVMIATKTTWFQDAWHAMVNAVVAAWNWVWGILKRGFAMLVSLILNFTGPGLFIKHFNTIRATVGAAMNWVREKVMSGVRGVLGAIAWLAALPGRVGRYFGGMAGAAADKASDLVATARGLPGRVTRAVGNLSSLLWDAGVDIIRGLIDGIDSMVGSLGSKLGSITSMIPDFKGPMTVDRVLLEPSGAAIMGGLMSGIGSQERALAQQLQGITDSVPVNVRAGVDRAGAGGGRDDVRVVLDVTGGDEALKRVIREMVDLDGGGDVQVTFGNRR